MNGISSIDSNTSSLNLCLKVLSKVSSIDRPSQDGGDPVNKALLPQTDLIVESPYILRALTTRKMVDCHIRCLEDQSAISYSTSGGEHVMNTLHECDITGA